MDLLLLIAVHHIGNHPFHLRIEDDVGDWRDYLELPEIRLLHLVLTLSAQQLMETVWQC